MKSYIVIYCPRCGSKNIRTFVAEWDVISQEDSDNTIELDEHQCMDCDGASFWM